VTDLERIGQEKAIAIIRAGSSQAALEAGRAALDGGLGVVEVTMNTPGALDAIRELAQKPGALVGAGTVLDRRTADACMAAGARLIVSPHTDPDLIAHVRSAGALAIPGALTPTEVVRAWQAGAHIVKIFPAVNVGGPEYLRLLRGPLSQVRLMPTGGVTVENATDYLSAGAYAVGLTSALFPPDLLAAADWPAIRERCGALAAKLRA
jgi:2-dehydro-3-deoxyphosphogluconate aldolase/(4S)-4-hydroxy-2-oxoglutarate aldolase